MNSPSEKNKIIQVDLEKRNFFKYSLAGIAMLLMNLSGIERLVKTIALVPGPDKIGLLYSTATGIILRTINPEHHEQHHFTWLQNNLPEGTTLLLLDKPDIGADNRNCPNLDYLIPYVKKHKAIDLSFGMNCKVVDGQNKVVDVVLCCPVLYQQRLDKQGQGLMVIPIQRPDMKTDKQISKPMPTPPIPPVLPPWPLQ